MLSNEPSTNFSVTLRHRCMGFIHSAPGFTVGSNKEGLTAPCKVLNSSLLEFSLAIFRYSYNTPQYIININHQTETETKIRSAVCIENAKVLFLAQI